MTEAGDDTKGAAATVFQLQLMSDLHLETPRTLPMYGEFHIESKCKYLALLGDIGSVYDNRLFQFLEAQLRQFEIVFYVFGNHEPYADVQNEGNNLYEDAVAVMQGFERRVSQQHDELGRFVFLNRTRYDVDDQTTILGCTLFSDISQDQAATISLFVSDFSNIPGWTVERHNTSHRQDIDWLNHQVDTISRNEPQRRIVILTHYSPSASLIANDPEHLEDSRGVLSAFVTDLSAERCWTSPMVKVWAFGHTHYNCDYVDDETGKRLVANQRGYGREDLFDFDAENVVSL